MCTIYLIEKSKLQVIDIMATADNSQIDYDLNHDGNQSQTLEQVVSENDPMECLRIDSVVN